MTVESLKKEARRHEQREEWIKALDLYLQAIEAQVGQDEPDIALHNRVGDLQVRLGDKEGAFDSYERAIALYLSAELPNNAVAVCRKVIRHDPERPTSYLRMGQIRAQQGFIVDARQQFITYAEMMQARGEPDESFRALEEFVALAPQDIDTRMFLAEQLIAKEQNEEALYYLSEAYRAAASQGQSDRQSEILERIHSIDPDHPVPTALETTSEEPDDFYSPEADEPMDLEITSFGEVTISDEVEMEAGLEALEGSSEISPDDSTGLAEELEVAVEEEESEGFEGLELTGFGMLDEEEEEDVRTGFIDGLESSGLDVEESTLDLGAPDLEQEAGDGLEEEEVAVFEELPSLGFEEEGDRDDEVGALTSELDADSMTVDADLEGEEDALPLIRYDLEEDEDERAEEPEGEGDLAEEEEVTVGFEGLGEFAVEEGVEDDEAAVPSPEAEAEAEEEEEEAEAEAESESEEEKDQLVVLTERVDDSPDDAEGWRLLGEELFARDRSEDAWEAMEKAHQAYAESGNPERAMHVVRELLVREPHRIDLRQRVVEYAHRTNERTVLVQAFLELADGLRAQGEALKADAVLEQVLEIDPGNLRANEALRAATGSAAGSTAESPAAEPATVETEQEEPQPAASGADSDYVDLGAMVLDAQGEATTRWKVEAEEPTGDEEADFARMLTQFKQKVAENIPGEDARSHYDLGAAYKEMGLFREAIGEFQQALRAQPKNLAAYEMLGQCFLEQGEPEVAIRTLERGLELPAPVEDDLLGMYYWLGQAHEVVGNTDSAREFYEKIFSLDINFRDVTDRLKALR